jgi:hypothetical protein
MLSGLNVEVYDDGAHDFYIQNLLIKIRYLLVVKNNSKKFNYQIA